MNRISSKATTTGLPVVVLFFSALFLCGPVYAQVSISPTSLFLSERAPFANVIISNGAAEAQEVTISFDFGYSVSDEQGNISMYYTEEEHERALTDYLNAFPRNFLLDPGERQTVRIAVRGLGRGDDGTYWSRARILASPLSTPVEATQEQGVAARININFEQVIPVFYRKGAASTAVQLNSAVFEQENDSQGHFLLDLEREGNSPFVGSIQTRILNSRGEQVLEQRSNISVYYDLRRKLTFSLEQLTPGEYRAEFTIQSQRRDISSSNLLQIQPVQTTQNFRVE